MKSIRVYEVLDPSIKDKSEDEQNKFVENTINVKGNIHLHLAENNKYYIIRVEDIDSEKIVRIDGNSELYQLIIENVLDIVNSV